MKEPLGQLCTRCNGTGVVRPAADDCPRCAGTGVEPAIAPLAGCPKCGGKRKNPRLLWTRSTGWGDVECGPICTDAFHGSAS